MSETMKPDKASAPKSMTVTEIKFTAPTDVPGKNQASAIMVKDEKNRSRWVVEYLAYMRHHQITLITPGKPDQVAYVHESRVASWK